MTRLGPEGAAVPAEVQAVSLNAGIRHLRPDRVWDRTQEAIAFLRRQACRACYLKVDSTLRGHLGRMAAAARAALGSELAVVAPAFPSAGRITAGGYQLVDSVPVAVSAYGQDPLAPVTQSHLPALLAQGAGEPVAHVGLDTVLEGSGAIAREFDHLRRQGLRLVSVDATRREDLEAIAAAIQHAPFSILPVGSAGLAEALSARTAPARLLGALPKAERAITVLPSGPPVLVINGSVNPVSLSQLDALQESVRVVPADVPQLLLTGSEEEGRLERVVLQSLFAGRDVVLTTSLSAEQVQRDLALAADLGLSPWQLGRHLSELLGSLSRRLIERAEVANLVLVGGETAAAVCDKLPSDRLELLAEVAPAIPCGRLVGTPLRIVTKSGGFGGRETLTQVVTHLRQTAP